MKQSEKIELVESLFCKTGSYELGEEQIEFIIRTLSAFMNTEGGELFIGINDKGEASANIINEYSLMNCYPAFPDEIYNENEDGYKSFIKDWTSKYLGNNATSLLDFEFLDKESVKVCKISVSKSSIPIWFNRTYLYIRYKTYIRRLMGDEITRLIQKITSLNIMKESNISEHVKRAKEEIGPNNGKKRILVVYPNGEYICEKASVDTMIKVIEKVGIQKVMKLGLTGRKGKGGTPYVPFIGKMKYNDNSGATQKEVEGYFIFTKYSIGELITKLVEISTGTDLGLHIEKY